MKVRRDPAQADEVLAMVREQVVPRSQAAPGFVKGTWFGDDKTGHGLILFDSERHAP